MDRQCSNCAKLFIKGDDIVACEGACGKQFHSSCINIKEYLEAKAVLASPWLCTSCVPVKSRSRGGRSRHTKDDLLYLEEEGEGMPALELFQSQRTRRSSDYEGEECTPEESYSSAWEDTDTISGNILDRIIRDPSRLKKPHLGKWAHHVCTKDTVAEDELNNGHQYRASLQPSPLGQMCSLRVTSEPNPVRQPAIIGTLGPSCATSSSIVKLLAAGLNIVRVDMAYADPCNTTSYTRSLYEAMNRCSAIKDYPTPVGHLMDLKGPEIRTGKINSIVLKDPGKVQLNFKKGDVVKLTHDKAFEECSNSKVIYVDYAQLVVQVRPGMTLYLSDASFKLKVDRIDGLNVVCEVQQDCVLRNYQQVHIPNVAIDLPTVTEFDVQCLELAIQEDVDMIAVPKVRNEETIVHVKSLLKEKYKDHGTLVLAKISNYEGVRNIDRIIPAADGIIIQRSDLATELSPAKVFIVQKEIIGKCNCAGKPVVCAGQILPSMVKKSTPCRIEISDVGSCIVDGADCIQLTSETAVGNNAPEAIAQLNEIIRESEAATMQKPFTKTIVDALSPAVEPHSAIAMAAVQVSNKLRAASILSITTSGKTAKLLSWFRPRCPVIAVTRVGKIARQLNLWRSVIPLHYTAAVMDDWFQDVNARFEYGISYGKDIGMIRSGDPLILVSGFRRKAGFTNCIRIVYAAADPRKT